MYIYFEMYKNTYGYMYFYTFFNNNTMHLIVLLSRVTVREFSHQNTWIYEHAGVWTPNSSLLFETINAIISGNQLYEWKILFLKQ